jgi:hypothetical protein
MEHVTTSVSGVDPASRQGMKTLHRSLLAALVLIVSCPPANAAVVYDNGGPDPALGGALSDTAAGEPTGSRQFSGDDFMFAGTGVTTVRDVHWYGQYLLSNTPAIDTFTIQFFNFIPEAGFFSAVPFYTAVVGGGRTDTGLNTTTGGFDIYAYSAVIPDVTFTNGQRYVLSIVNNTAPDLDDQWFWTRSLLTTLHFERFNETDPWAVTGPGALAFQLTDDGAQGVPEPTSLAVLSFGLAGVVLVRRRR